MSKSNKKSEPAVKVSYMRRHNKSHNRGTINQNVARNAPRFEESGFGALQLLGSLPGQSGTFIIQKKGVWTSISKKQRNKLSHSHPTAVIATLNEVSQAAE